jgi:hypothetical protein
MEQFQITSKPRHLRHVFFVDENSPYESLLSLIQLNQKGWGGRYNPIVPVKDNIISDRWKEILKYYDPDYVYYSKEVDPEIIKKLRIFNPTAYCNLDDQPRWTDVKGVSSFFLLSEFHVKSRIILTTETWKTKSPLLSYYKTNFGLETDLIGHEVELSKDYDRKIVGEEDFKLLNKYIAELKPLNLAHLSRRILNTVILRSKNYTGYFPFEIVIAKDNSSNDDLFYFWNRMLFELRNIIYITLEELNLLCEDEYFGQVLYDMDSGNEILVTSQSFSKDELQDIIDNKLRKTKVNKRFENGRKESFPFEVMDANSLFGRHYGEAATVQTVHSREGLLHVPKLSFSNKLGINPKGWALDIQGKNANDDYRNNLELPLTTETHYIIKGIKGRINRQRNISVFISTNQNASETLEFSWPEFTDLVRQLISSPVIDGETMDTKYRASRSHDASNRLTAFLKTFHNDFSTIDDFFIDKFWVSLFEELSTSKKAVGDSILLKDIIAKCKKELAIKGTVELDENGILKGKKGQTFKNEENLELGLKSTIDSLCDYRVFLKGFNLKCNHCSSQFWYHINEVKDSISCKGCLDDFQFPVEPNFAYKLNDLIKNNIFQSNGLRDGNLTVIRTLVSMHRRSMHSFEWCPQLNLYKDHESKPCGDLDIVCLVDGKFIIGEAKHDSKLFSEDKSKALVSMAEIAKAIRPDKIILSCYEDSHNRLEKAKRTLIRIFDKWEYLPEIETLKLYSPSDFHLGNYRYFYY